MVTAQGTKDNPRFPDYCVIERDSDENGVIADPFNIEVITKTIYDGVCRWRESEDSSNLSVDVLNTVQKTFIPLSVSDWDEDVIPLDRIIVTRGKYTAVGTVISSTATNYGTTINWRYVRN